MNQSSPSAQPSPLMSPMGERVPGLSPNPEPRTLNPLRSALPVLLAALLTLLAQAAAAQNVVDEIEVARGALKADRKVVIAEEMKLTDQESSAFWPIYRNYRAEMDKVGDGRVELVLEYADLYPDVPEDRAQAMLKKYAALEAKSVDVRNKYLKKLGKILPAAKVLRFAQLENRLDLAVRLQMAARIPLVPVAKSR